MSTEHSKLYYYIKGGHDRIQSVKRESMFVQLLEALHPSEAEVLLHAKDKQLHKVYKGLSDAVVKESFNWDENYRIKNV